MASKEELEADWLRDTLRDVARRIRQPGASRSDLEQSAIVLERIVADLAPSQSVSTDDRREYLSMANRGWRRWLLTLGLAWAIWRLLARRRDA